MIDTEIFASPSAEWRSVPFWALNDVLEPAEVERLDEHVLDAEAHGLDGTAERGAFGREDDRAFAVGLQLPRELEGVGVRKLELGQDEIVAFGHVAAESFGGRLDVRDVGVQHPREVLGEHLAGGAVGVSEQDSRAFLWHRGSCVHSRERKKKRGRRASRP